MQRRLLGVVSVRHPRLEFPMKRSALLFALLLAAAPAIAGNGHSVITTKTGKTFYDCKVTRVYPDGVGFTHRNGAAKIAFKDLPESLRNEFRYDPKAEAAYKSEQAALREEEKKRAKLREAAMQEQLMEARMAEASYLAAANSTSRAPTLISPTMPGEAPLKTVVPTPSWVGTPITGTAMGGSVYQSGNYSRWRAFPGYGGGGYYPATSGYYPSFGGYSYPYGGYPYSSGYGYPYSNGYPTGAYVGPTIYRQWNVGGGLHLGIGVSPFGSVLHVR